MASQVAARRRRSPRRRDGERRAGPDSSAVRRSRVGPSRSSATSSSRMPRQSASGMRGNWSNGSARVEHGVALAAVLEAEVERDPHRLVARLAAAGRDRIDAQVDRDPGGEPGVVALPDDRRRSSRASRARRAAPSPARRSRSSPGWRTARSGSRCAAGRSTTLTPSGSSAAAGAHPASPAHRRSATTRPAATSRRVMSRAAERVRPRRARLR